MGTPWAGGSLCSEPGLKGETPSLTACPLGPHLDKESITSVLADLQGRVSSLQGLTSDLQGKNGKVSWQQSLGGLRGCQGGVGQGGGS